MRLIENVQIHAHTRAHEWLEHAKEAANTLLHAHRARKRIELADTDTNRHRKLDAAYLRRIGEFLDATPSDRQKPEAGERTGRRTRTETYPNSRKTGGL